MRARRGCGEVLLGVLLVIVACLVFAALAAAPILTGELPIRRPYLTGLEPDPSFSLSAYESHYAHLRPTMDPDSVSATFSLDPYVPGALEWNPEFSQVTFVPEGAGYEPGQHVFSYLMQAVTSGDSAVLPTHVDPMFEPEVWSCSEGTRQTRLNCADLCRSEPWWRHLPLREPLVRRHLGPFVQKN